MKYTLSFIVFFLLTEVHAQMSFTYSPENSEMTVLFTEEVILHSGQLRKEFDLKGKWRYKKCKKVNVFIRGALTDELNEDTLTQTVVTFEIFGKKFEKPLYLNKDYTVEFRRPGRLVYRKPKIVISSPPLPQGRSIYIESFDMSANKYPKKTDPSQSSQ